MIKRHPETGYHILKSVDKYSVIAEDILSHHEKLDGTGYPRGIKGDKISMTSRIITVADAYEAMTAIRPYRDSMPKGEAIEELKRNVGIQFDENVVTALLSVLDEG